MSEFLAMGGYGFYVWGSYVVTLAVIVVEVIGVRARHRRAAEHAAQAPTRAAR
jgi:heme exporter protein D